MVQVIKYQPEMVSEAPTRPCSPFLNVDLDMLSGFHTGFVQFELFKMLVELRKLEPETLNYDSLEAKINMWQEAIAVKRRNGAEVTYDSVELLKLIDEYAFIDNGLESLESRLKEELGINDFLAGPDSPTWKPIKIPPINY